MFSSEAGRHNRWKVKLKVKLSSFLQWVFLENSMRLSSVFPRFDLTNIDDHIWPKTFSLCLWRFLLEFPCSLVCIMLPLFTMSDLIGINVCSEKLDLCLSPTYVL